MSTELTTCRHCGELIVLIGARWLHSKTERTQCEPPLRAEPIDRLMPDAVDAAAYQQGLRDGRMRAAIQDRKSNLYVGPLSGIAKEILARAFQDRYEDVKRVESLCESPVEEMFALAVIMEADLYRDASGQVWKSEDGQIELMPQRQIGAHRVDFVFNERLVVEIDGHDFHDRTQEQASHDRKRDRDLLRGGFLVIRFTGADVYNAPLRCVSETTDLLGMRINLIK